MIKKLKKNYNIKKYLAIVSMLGLISSVSKADEALDDLLKKYADKISKPKADAIDETKLQPKENEKAQQRIQPSASVDLIESQTVKEKNLTIKKNQKKQKQKQIRSVANSKHNEKKLTETQKETVPMIDSTNKDFEKANEGLFGDWNGLKSVLSDNGFDLGFSYC